jgi:hypothetical protein
MGDEDEVAVEVSDKGGDFRTVDVERTGCPVGTGLIETTRTERTTTLRSDAQRVNSG